MSSLVGVLGGMGPMASQLFYKMVNEKTDAKTDQDHLRMLIYSDSSVPDRTKAILSGDTEEVEEVYNHIFNDFDLLKKAGCDIFVVTCNTAHYFAEKVERETNLPFINMIEETCKYLSRENEGEKVAILATTGTRKTELYQEHMLDKGVIPYIPSNKVQEMVMYEIYDRVKAGKKYDANVWHEIEKEIKKEGCKRAIMACTELSVIKQDEHLGNFYVDPMEVLAEKVIESSGKKLK